MANPPESPWSDVGIHGPARVRALAFNAASQHLIAHVSLRASRSFPGFDRLFYRHVRAKTYVQVPVEDEALDAGEPHSCPDAPYVLFLLHRTTDEHRRGRNWSSISRLALPSGAVEKVTTGLQLPEGYARGWVSGLLRVHPDCASVTAIVGLQPPPAAGSNRATYAIADIAAGSGAVTVIADLAHPFFERPPPNTVLEQSKASPRVLVAVVA